MNSDPQDPLQQLVDSLSPEERLLLAQSLSKMETDDSVRSAPFDPIENAMKRHPGLTREEAEKMAESLGF